MALLHMHCRRGFTLIELSVWITILAILAASVLSFMTPPSVDEATRIQTTQDNMRRVLDALIDFRATNGRLPCPALITQTDDAATAYTENCTANRGAVPARTLGISEETAIDGWGRRITYHVASTICGTDASGLPLNCTEAHYRLSNILNPASPPPTGNLEIRSSNMPGGANNNRVTTQAAFVLVSHGVNGSGGFNRAGVQLGASTNALEVENANGDTLYRSEYYGLQPAAGQAVFDDFLLYRTRAQLEFEVMDPAKLSIGENVANRNTSEGVGKAIFCFDYDPTNMAYPPVTAGVVDSVQEALLAFNLSTYTAINKLRDSNNTTLNTYFTPSVAADRLLSFLWNVQEICHYYYPTSGTRTGGKRCPPGNATARTYNGDSLGCRCPSGTWQLNGANYGCL